MIMNSTLSLIINVPTLFLLYILTYFTQSLSGKRQFYGISLNYDYFKKLLNIIRERELNERKEECFLEWEKM